MPHSYIFFDSEPSIASLSKDDLRAYKDAFAALIANRPEVRTRAYATLAFKAGMRFMLHLHADEASTIQDFVRDLLHTDLGQHLKITYTLLGLRRPSPYNPKGTLSEEENPERKYLIVYPFTKTIGWHLLPKEERGRIMKDHVAVGRTFNESISQLLLYSYGIDDHEFIVSYQTDSLLDFQTLVMELRGTEGRGHTLRDTPIFTCTRQTIQKALEMI
jgi:chlorite dismutase